MFTILKYAFVLSVFVFAAYHFYPVETVSTGKKIADKTTRAAKEITK